MCLYIAFRSSGSSCARAEIAHFQYFRASAKLLQMYIGQLTQQTRTLSNFGVQKNLIRQGTKVEKHWLHTRGPRLFPGKEYARLVVLTFIHNVVKKYKWAVLFPKEKVLGDMVPMPEKGVPIRLHPH
ncbi:hypothetical protein HYC85_013925 [Camellia sinensis]|uniref:Uncharacterized protein n=1 Tax=Camellia sinensis TaxID=4442 RepID=A0A7J7H891_CAMSI|nr:hypothetical protein HYC85_013925 [Camellia sinensis]